MRLLLIGAALSASVAFAQQYPARPLRLIVPFAPGGAADVTTRFIAPFLLLLCSHIGILAWVSNSAFTLVGGLGVVPGANLGESCAVFEAVHGSAPKYAGMNKVNPTAVILSAVLMLEHLGEKDAARRLESAVAGVIAEGKRVTYDLKQDRDDPTAVGTKEMADAIIAGLRKTR